MYTHVTSYLHMLSLSNLPYKNMLPLQPLLDMIHHLDKINCHMVKLKCEKQNAFNRDQLFRTQCNI